MSVGSFPEQRLVIEPKIKMGNVKKQSLNDVFLIARIYAYLGERKVV